ncbi:MAG: radical SAM protein [Elusimicrobiota bacterium]
MTPNNSFFKPAPADSAGLITNYRCTNTCAHCLYGSSPCVEEQVSPETLKEIIRNIKREIPHCSIHIGGGEPFLDFDLLGSTVETVLQNGLCLEYVETNGILLSGQDSRDKLLALRRLGLKCILLSISPFHNEFISIEDSKKIFSLITDIFGNDGIFPWHPAYYDFIKQTACTLTSDINEYFSFFSAEEIYRQLTNVIYIHPAGRAAFVFRDFIGGFPAAGYFSKNCAGEASSPTHAHIDYAGNYCAGFCSGLTIGQEAGCDLGELYRRGIDLEEYPILDILINRTLGDLFEYTLERGFTEKKSKDKSEEKYSSSCHLCMHLRTFLYFRFPGKYKELASGLFYEDMKERFGL